MATSRVMRQFEAMGAASLGLETDGQTSGRVIARVRKHGDAPLVTDNGQHIIDVTGLQIADPLAFESQVNQWPGVVTVGVFAHQHAHVCLLGTGNGVKTLEFAKRLA